MNRPSPMVPNHGGGVEAEFPALLLQAPAQIHVVPGNTELRVKASHRGQAAPAKSHIAARQVFGLAIRQ